MAHDIRMNDSKGFQPQMLDTTERIKRFGWDKFEQQTDTEPQPKSRRKSKEAVDGE